MRKSGFVVLAAVGFVVCGCGGSESIGPFNSLSKTIVYESIGLPGQSAGAALAVSGNSIGGGILGNPVLWTGPTASPVNLHVANLGQGEVNGVDENSQVGLMIVSGSETDAYLWTGTAASAVNLNPSVTTFSVANGVSGGLQVGYAKIGGADHAALWQGTAASYVDLHPNSYTSSHANAISGTLEVGTASQSNVVHACSWQGSAGTFVDLNPSTAAASSAQAVSGTTIGGDVTSGGAVHAGVWTGAADSFVDLNPAGSTSSSVTGVSGNYAVGYAYLSGSPDRKAVLWNWTTKSFVNLGTVLGSKFSTSVAQGVSPNSGLDIVGYAIDSTGVNPHAIRWHVPVAFLPK